MDEHEARVELGEASIEQAEDLELAMTGSRVGTLTRGLVASNAGRDHDPNPIADVGLCPSREAVTEDDPR